MLFPYLPSAPPETQETILREFIRRPAAYRIHGPFYPSVVLTEPPEDGSLIMLQQLFAIRRMLSGDYRPAPAQIERPSSRLPLMLLPAAGSYLMTVYAVVKVLFHSVTTGGRYEYILKRKWTTAVGPVGPVDGSLRAINTPVNVTNLAQSSIIGTLSAPISFV